MAVGVVDFEAAVLSIAAEPRMHVVRRCVDVADLVATAASRQADAALISAQLRGIDAEIVDRLRSEGVAVVGVVAEASSADEALLRQIGVDHVASVDDLVSLAELVSQAVRSPHRPPEADRLPDRDPHESRPLRRAGPVVAVWGPTGAPGRSTVALGVSAELSSAGASTHLVDADVYGGAVAAMLGMLDESSGLLAAARAANSGSLTVDLLAAQARQVDRNLRVLTGLPRADRWTEVKAVLLRNILEVSRSLAAFTVVDCGFNLEFDEEISYDTSAPRRNGATVEALERADVVLVVGAADPVSLSRLIRGVSELKTVLPSVSPWIVVNRLRTSSGWSPDEVVSTVQKATGVHSVRVLPDDPASCSRALMYGRSLVECAPDARLSRAMNALAGELVAAGRGAAAVPARRRRWR